MREPLNLPLTNRRPPLVSWLGLNGLADLGDLGGQRGSTRPGGRLSRRPPTPSPTGGGPRVAAADAAAVAGGGSGGQGAVEGAWRAATGPLGAGATGSWISVAGGAAVVVAVAAAAERGGRS